MNKLTVIIPFLNEGIEVENTLNSIRTTAKNNVDILLINDNSTDDFDYKSVANKYNAKYIKNKERKGVAQSRNIGVSKISTPYFILLDAHMRFYQNDWWDIATKHLEADERAVYCLKCLPLNNDGELSDEKVGYGACISLFGYGFNTVLEPLWIDKNNIENSIMDIPCVLGASYIMSKQYWDYLKGLSMLRYYGTDEAYLSLKVWLEGGSCKVITDVGAGHIFRKEAPFKIITIDSIYNKLLIAETALPEDYTQYLHASLKSLHYKDYYIALSLINKNRSEIIQLREYYQSIFTKDFSSFKKLNGKYNKVHSPFIKIAGNNIQVLINKKLDEIANAITKLHTPDAGLLIGGIGEIIFLIKYSRLKKNSNLEKTAKKYLDIILDKGEINSCNLQSGASGFGVGLKYLINQGFIDIDLDEIFEDIDEDIFLFMQNEIEKDNFDFLTGALGAGFYFFYRDEAKYISHIGILLSAIEIYLCDLINKKDISLGIDGLSGILRFLVLLYDKTPSIKLIGLISKLTTFILAQIQNTEKYSSYFPNIVDKTSKSGLEYKSGDLIIAYNLLLASEILNNQLLYDQSMEILLSTTRRKDPVIESVNDAGFYTGSSGITYIYNRLYKKTKNTLFLDAYSYWINETLYKSVGPMLFAGYLAYDNNSTPNNLGLQNGIAGIGQNLLLYDSIFFVYLY